jgi:hypothetical protein
MENIKSLVSVNLCKSSINKWCLDSSSDSLTLDFSRGYDGGDIIVQFYGIRYFVISGDLSDGECFYVADFTISQNTSGLALDSIELTDEIEKSSLLRCHIEGALCMEIVFRHHQVFYPDSCGLVGQA